MENETVKRVRSWMQEKGVKLFYQFIPQSFSRNTNEKTPSLNWIVKLSRGNKNFSTDFMQGIGHVPGYLFNAQAVDDVAFRMLQDKASETGQYPSNYPYSHRLTHLSTPDDTDVLYCLLSDISCMDMSFDEWCSEYGYDTDSRKAFKMYEVCREIEIKMSEMFTPAEMAELQELLANY